jgi:hypothetical protein
MTEKEMQDDVNQARQDAVTLDYSKWSDQQRRAKLSTDHDLWQQQRDRVLARRQSENAEAGRKYRESLEAAKTERQREREAQIDRELEPQKQMLMREWLANNPTLTANDFEKKAWQHLRTNLIEKMKADALNAEIQNQKATGRYSL